MPYLVATEISTGKFSSLLKSWQTGLDFCELQKRATPALRRLGDRAVWMVSSTARRGGVAEHLFSFVTVLRHLGVNVQWLVIESDDSLFIDSAKSLIVRCSVKMTDHSTRQLFIIWNRRTDGLLSLSRTTRQPIRS